VYRGHDVQDRLGASTGLQEGFMSRLHRPSFAFVTACLAAGVLVHGSADAASRDSAAVARLRAHAGAGARVSVSPATGTARFVSLPAGRAADLSPLAAGSAEQKTAAFLAAHGEAFGVRDASQLVPGRRQGDPTGMTHLSYRQVYAGVPVFAAVLKTHFDASGALRAVNGVVIPDVAVDPVPRLTPAEAGQIALGQVASQKQPKVAPTVRRSTLYVFRAGLVKGVPGSNHLAYEIEVGNGRDVREFVYVDAHNGAIVDQWSGVHEALNRRVYDGGYDPTLIVWEEGDPLPHPDADINNIITFSGDTHAFFNTVFGRDSYDGAGHIMETVNDDPGLGCPNASWNGTSTNYCTGVTGDDTVGHEWGHAYTEYTHGLIYAWQPGALNESYSDIWGEVVDTVNGPNLPDTPRVANACSQHGGAPPPSLTITGGSAAGSYQALASVNEPPRPFTVGPTPMALSNPPGACTTVTGVAGSIAIIDWTLLPGGANECGSVVRATNALNAGATGIIFVAPASGVLNLGSIATIGSVQVTYADGQVIKSGLPASATMAFDLGTDNTFRWLSGEDDTSGGAIRDMWNPTCFGDPGQVAEGFYTCAPTDGGGVHTNSGVPNHAFALTVDGGTFNGQTITGLGMTKAAHIYFRAQTQYQTSITDFPDHADSLEQSCTDLIGAPLTNVLPGPPVTISAADCTELHEVMLAVGMRSAPGFCNFQPQFSAAAPPACSTGTQSVFFSETFESNPAGSWTFAHQGVVPADFTPRDWTWQGSLPGGRPGSALLGPDPDIGTCAAGGDESGVLFATSPAFTIPAGSTPKLSFEHWVSTEAGFDGANVKISVNGGPFELVNGADFSFNPYGQTLTAAPTNTNPMASEQAFQGTDGGSVGGTWARSYVNLAPYATAGDSVRLRLDMGTDGCTGFVGVFMDDITGYQCLGEATLSASDTTVVEGNSGSTDAFVNVTLSSAGVGPVTVDFATADGTATTADNDYTAATGTITFAPGQTTRTVTVSVVGDTTVEPSETFFVNLSNANGAAVGDGQGQVGIVNDDGGTGITDTRSELSHGYRTRRALNNASNSNLYWVQTQAASSYEVVVDEASGDLGVGNGPDLHRLSADGATVLGTGEAVGTGTARSLRWATSTSGALNLVRVQSASCNTGCGADDTYRLRAYETTYAIPRFNNTGSQITVLLLQNPTDSVVNVTAYFYDGAGTALTSQAVAIDPKSLAVINTSGIGPVNNQSGSIVVTHDAPYASLAGKAVALEPSTGFSFDSPMLPRAR
jgi:Zn-dependent metalloprotease